MIIRKRAHLKVVKQIVFKERIGIQMDKIKEFCASRKFTMLLMILGTVLLFYYFGRNIPHINTVWELVDEYGYLANAAYLSDSNWSYMVSMYYGYGYSLWLVPLFWFCQTGSQIIRGAVWINTLFIVLLFWVQYILMSKVCSKLNKNVVALVSFVLCFSPYLVASDMKVICETLLTLMIWVCGLLLYQAIETGKFGYFILLAIGTAYTFFVHTRALIFCAVLFFVLFIALIQKKVSTRNILIYIGTFGVMLLAGYLVKNNIIDMVYSTPVTLATSEETEVVVGNTLSVTYMLKKIGRVFTNFTVFTLYSFACKNFYLFVSTAGLFYIGLFSAVASVIKERKSTKTLSADSYIKLLFSIAVCVMVVACIIQNYGRLETPAYFFYGRYFEYLVAPIVFIGIDHCIEKKINIWVSLAWILSFLIFAFFTFQLSQYLELMEIGIDTARMSAFSYVMDQVWYYEPIIRCCTKLALVFMIIVLVLNRLKKMNWLIPGALLVLFLLNDQVITKTILSVHENNTDYYAVAEFIHENYSTDEVYFLNSDFLYVTTYTGIQCTLGKEKMVVLNEEDIPKIESGDVMICFHNNPYLDKITKNKTKVFETNWYEVYFIE